MIDLGDEVGEAFARSAGSAAARALTPRKSLKRQPGGGGTEAAERSVPPAVRDAARTATFAKGAEGNRTVEFATSAQDPRAEIIAGPLTRAGVPFSVSFSDDGSAASFEVSREGSLYIEALAARYVAAGVLAADRFPNLSLPDAESRYYTYPVSGRDRFEAVRSALTEADAVVLAEWDPAMDAGLLTIRQDQASRALSIISAVDALPEGALRGDGTQTAFERAAKEPPGRETLVFQTREDDPRAEIIANALRRAGVPDNEFAVATPDPQGQVVISVAKGRAPALVQVAESYIDRDVIEAERFKGLDALRSRVSARRETAEMRVKEGALESARSQARTAARSRSAAAPELERKQVR